MRSKIKSFRKVINMNTRSKIKLQLWIKAALIRAIKTMAQAAIAMIGTAVVISDVDWKLTISASIVAGILSILTSIAGLPEVDDTKVYEKIIDKKR